MKLIIKIFAAFVLLVFVFSWFYMADIIKKNTAKESGLSYYGNDSTNADKYQIENFSFLNQDSILIEKKDFANKIWVTDFFFTTCHSICPIMSNHLASVQEKFAKDTNFKILSHTVDPEYDNIKVLKKYAQDHNYIPRKWHFVTGNDSIIYSLARNSYFIATPKDSSLHNNEEDFVHSQLLALIDPHFHIRGYYDGTNYKEIQKLILDIKKLKEEYKK